MRDAGVDRHYNGQGALGELMLNTYIDDLFVAENCHSNLVASCTVVHPPTGRDLQLDLPSELPKLGVQNDSFVGLDKGRRVVSVVCT